PTGPEPRATFTSTSIRPKEERASSAAAMHCASSVTLHLTTTTSAPPAFAFSATGAIATTSRPASVSRQPSAAKARLIATPIPLAGPVIMTLRPRRSRSITERLDWSSCRRLFPGRKSEVGRSLELYPCGSRDFQEHIQSEPNRKDSQGSGDGVLEALVRCRGIGNAEAVLSWLVEHPARLRNSTRWDRIALLSSQTGKGRRHHQMEPT